MSFGQRFLTYPDLFPGRPSGEAWGTAALSLDFPGAPVEVEGLADSQAEAIAEHFPTILAERFDGDSQPTLLRLFRVSLSDFDDAEPQPFELDFERRPGAVRCAGWHLMGRLDWTNGDLAAALFTPHAGGMRFTNAFENFCRAIVAHRLLESGGVLVHSAAAAGAAGGRLFVGSSGAGKTTTWGLLRREGVQVLCDDLNILRRRGDALHVASTPFSTEPAMRLAPISSHPLRQIHFLRQGVENSTRALGRAEAVGRLFTNSPFVNRDAHREAALFDTLTAICTEVPTSELTFAKRPGLWAWLDAQERVPANAQDLQASA